MVSEEFHILIWHKPNTTGGENKTEHPLQRLLLLPSPLPFLFFFHSSCHFCNVLIPSLYAEPLEKVWCLWSTFPHRPCNFWLYFYVFQIQVNLKVPASQVTLTLRTSQKMVSLVGDSSCCPESPSSQQPASQVQGFGGLPSGQPTVGTSLRTQGVVWIRGSLQKPQTLFPTTSQTLPWCQENLNSQESWLLWEVGLIYPIRLLFTALN